MAFLSFLKPELQHHSKHLDRKASWLELFFDLTLVVPIFQLSHYLAEHLSFTTFIGFVILFAAVFEVWMHHAYYNEQFKLPEGAMRVLTLIKVFLLIIMTTFIPTAFEGGAVGFVIAFSIIRFLMIAVWEGSAYFYPTMKKMIRNYSIGSFLGTIFFLISLFFPHEYLMLFWGVAIIIDQLTPMILFNRKNLSQLSFSEHLPERFGLFFLIILGEGIITVTLSFIENQGHFWQLLPLAFLGLLMVFGIWWLYFDTIMEKPVRRNNSNAITIWRFSHMMLFIFTISVSTGILLMIEHMNSVHIEYIILLSTMLAGVLLSMAIIERTLDSEENTPCMCRKGVISRSIAVILSLLVIGLMHYLLPVWVLFMVLNIAVWWQVIYATVYNISFIGR